MSGSQAGCSSADPLRSSTAGSGAGLSLVLLYALVLVHLKLYMLLVVDSGYLQSFKGQTLKE